MYLFIEIIARLKEKFNITSDKELYDLMGVTQGTFSNWKNRNKIPYEELTTICFNNNLDLRYILTGENDEKIQNENNKNNKINHREELIKMLEDLNDKKAEIYYHLIKAELLKEKL